MKKLTVSKYLSIKYFLIQNKNYLPNYGNLLDIELSLKQILQIIFEYHINKRKILFLGFPKFKNTHYENVLKTTGHSFVPSNVWADGLFSNSKSLSIHLKKQLEKSKESRVSRFLQNLNVLLSEKVETSLVVIFNSDISDSLIKELSNLRLPVITFNLNKKLQKLTTYNVPSMLSNSIIKKLCLFLIYSMFLRTLKTKLSYVSLKLFKIRFSKLKIFFYKRIKYRKKFRFFSKRKRSFNKKFHGNRFNKTNISRTVTGNLNKKY